MSITSKHLSFLSGCLERSGFKQHSSSMDAKMEGVMLPLGWQWNFALSSVAAKDLVRSICPKSVCVWLHCLSVPYKPKNTFTARASQISCMLGCKLLKGTTTPGGKGSPAIAIQVQTVICSNVVTAAAVAVLLRSACVVTRLVRLSERELKPFSSQIRIRSEELHRLSSGPALSSSLREHRMRLTQYQAGRLQFHESF